MRLLETEHATVYFGSNLDVLPTLEDNSVDSIVTDPPYELGFMGKKWDSSGIAYNVELWKECLRVLKPGGHLLSFSGSRTYHRMTVAIEDSGFEIRDMISWISNKTFPKSLDVSKAIDKQRNDKLEVISVVKKMKQALEFSGKSRSELDKIFGTKNVAQHWFSTDSDPRIVPADKWIIVKEWLKLDDSLDAEVWRLNGRKGKPGEAWSQREVIDERNVPKGHSFASEKYGKETGVKKIQETISATPEAEKWQGWGTGLKPTVEPIVMARKPLNGTVAANVLEYGTGALNIDGSRIGVEEIKINTFDNGAKPFGDAVGEPYTSKKSIGRWPANAIIDDVVAEALGDNSKFFYVPKASKVDRNEGLDKENNHPTVKPTALMSYLVKLVTPPNGIVLDPFTGSGSTGKAAILEGFQFVGIELTEDYWPIIKGRLEHAETQLTENKEKEGEQLF